MSSLRKTIQWLLTFALAAFVFSLAASHSFYESSIISPYFSAALAGAAIIFACIRQAREFGQVLVLTGLLWGIELGIAGLRVGAAKIIVPTISLLGLAAFLLLGIRAIWATGEQRKLLLCAFIPAVFFAASDWFASTLLAMTERLHPQTYDYFLYSFDASLVWQPGVLLAGLYAQNAWFHIVSEIVYVGLAIPIALVYGLQLRRGQARALPVMYAFLLTGPLGVVFYNLLPAMGPAHVFRGVFPHFMPDYHQAAHLVPSLAALPGPRNAIPSLHMAWVLLAWWNSKGLHPVARAIVLFFVVFTVGATLGTGEHYVVDLIVAYPFALLLQSVCKTTLPVRARRRWVPLLASAATILLWFALLKYDYRFFWISPSIPWLFALFTISGSVALHYWMQSPVEATSRDVVRVTVAE